MSSRFNEFLELHQKPEYLLVGNAWSAQSARILEQEGLKVIGTSSAAVADSHGYADGEEMSFDFYFRIIERIVASVSTMVTVDLEGGYGKTTADVVANIKALYEIGIVGVNLEDSILVSGKRQILDKDLFAAKLTEICAELTEQKIEMFINVRSDCYLIPVDNPLEDAMMRIEAYQRTGVHGLFFPCLIKLDDIKQITHKSFLPINIMCLTDMPDRQALISSGVKRVSLGPFLNMRLYRDLPGILNGFKETGNFNTLF